jgi:hypothetical protein
LLFSPKSSESVYKEAELFPERLKRPPSGLPDEKASGKHMLGFFGKLRLFLLPLLERNSFPIPVFIPHAKPEKGSADFFSFPELFGHGNPYPRRLSDGKEAHWLQV